MSGVLTIGYGSATLQQAVFRGAVDIDSVDFSTRFELTCLASRGHEPLITRFMQIVQRLAR